MNKVNSCGFKIEGGKERRIIRIQNKMSCELSNQAPKHIALLTLACLSSLFFPSPFSLFFFHLC